MSNLFRKSIQAVVKHPIVSLIGGLLFIVIVIVLLSSGGNNETTPESPVPITGDPSVNNQPIQPADPLTGVGGSANGEQGSSNNNSFNPEEIQSSDKPVRDLNGNIVPPEHVPAPDIHDVDPETQAQTEELLNSAPAFQKLPLSRKNVFADLEDILPDGRMVILVRYSGNINQAKRTWNQFLRTYKDSGKKYLVIYRR
jgi:hypothetical protein